MNNSISSCDSHIINSINSSLALKFKPERTFNNSLKSIDSQFSSRSISSIDRLNPRFSEDFQYKSRDSSQILQRSLSSSSIVLEIPPKKGIKKRRLTLPPPKIMEMSESSKISILKLDNYLLLKNIEKFFECFKYKKNCFQKMFCLKIGVLDKLTQLKNKKIEEKFCKRSFKRITKIRNDLNMNYDRYINIIDLNVLIILVRDGNGDFEDFLSAFGVRILYLQIYGVTEKVLEKFNEVVAKSSLYETVNPFGFMVRVVAGYFLRNFKLVHGKYNFFDVKYIIKLFLNPDEYYNALEINS